MPTSITPVIHDTDTIAAIATAPGSGGIGIVRLSGPQAIDIVHRICKITLVPRRAHYARFRDEHDERIDDGIALAFIAPHSYTGEHVVELQAHGSPAVLQALVQACCAHGARRARAGEFSERAFRNGKLDLAQAEAVADLIAAGDAQAARAARRSLDGVFSRRVDALAAMLMAIRVQVEAGIDFADEPLETLGGAALRARLHDARNMLDALLIEAERGQRLRDGLHVVIVGPPNVGKSSLLNALAGSDRAIVTDIAGTTRDLLRETVRVDGIELTLVDTAGLRTGADPIEREGIRRARTELQRADLAIVVLDARDPSAGEADIAAAIADVPQVLRVHNKVDLLTDDARANTAASTITALRVSAQTGDGLEALRARLREQVAAPASGEGAFSARARHVQALRQAQVALGSAAEALDEEQLDLAAEDLRIGHDHLGEITGRTLPDALLGEIFAGFCIGK